MKRTGFFFRTLMAVIFIGLLAVGAYALFQAGVTQGYSTAILSEGLEGAERLAPQGGFAPYRYPYGFGFHPFFWGIGMVFKLFFFFLLFGFLFRMLFFRRAWSRHGWHGGPGSRKDWEEHWGKHQRGPWGPWMEREGEPTKDEPEDEDSPPEE